MSFRDDNGSGYGTGQNGFGGGGYNGGVGGGMGGGGMGGGAGRNGGMGQQTGMTTGTQWHGNTAFGRPGGTVQAYGMRDPRSLANAGMGPTMGSYSGFKTPQGQAMFPGMNQSFQGMNMGQALGQAQQQWGLMNQLNNMHSNPAGQPMAPEPGVIPGVRLPPPQAVIPPAPVPQPPPAPYVPGSMAPWPGQSAIPNNPPVYSPPPAPGSTHYMNGSTFYKNGPSYPGTPGYAGSTHYKNGPSYPGTPGYAGSTHYKNNY